MVVPHNEVILLRRSGFLQRLPANVRIIADRGFRCADIRVVVKYDTEATFQQRMHNERLELLRWQVETAFARIKNFAVLRDKYRGDLSRHRLIFMCAVHAYNIDVVVHPLVAN